MWYINIIIIRSSKPAPIITKEYTSSIEELIIKRIKDERFDDVVYNAANDRSRGNNDDADGYISCNIHLYFLMSYFTSLAIR
jgi:hypothetical protein